MLQTSDWYGQWTEEGQFIGNVFTNDNNVAYKWIQAQEVDKIICFVQTI